MSFIQLGTTSPKKDITVIEKEGFHAYYLHNFFDEIISDSPIYFQVNAETKEMVLRKGDQEVRLRIQEDPNCDFVYKFYKRPKNTVKTMDIKRMEKHFVKAANSNSPYHQSEYVHLYEKFPNKKEASGKE